MPTMACGADAGGHLGGTVLRWSATGLDAAGAVSSDGRLYRVAAGEHPSGVAAFNLPRRGATPRRAALVHDMTPSVDDDDGAATGVGNRQTTLGATELVSASIGCTHLGRLATTRNR